MKTLKYVWRMRRTINDDAYLCNTFFCTKIPFSY